MFPGSTGTNSIREDNYTTHSFTSNCSTAILAGAAKEKWEISYAVALTAREF